MANPWALSKSQNKGLYPSVNPEDYQDDPSANIQAAAQAGSPAPQSDFTLPTNPFPQAPPVDLQPMGALPPAPLHSGLKNENMAEGENKYFMDEKAVRMMTPEQVQAAYDNVAKLPAAKEQMEGLDKLQDMLRMQTQMAGKQVDLTPLMNLANYTSGVKPEYKAPADPQAVMKNAFDAAQKIQSDKRDLTKSMLDFSKQKAGTDETLQSSIAKFMQKRLDEDPDLLKHGSSDLNAYRLTKLTEGALKPVNEANANLAQAQNLLDNAQSVSDTEFRNKFARMMVGGRLSNYDIMIQAGDKALAARAMQTIQNITDGTFTPQNREEFQQALDVIKQANDQEASLRRAYHREVGVHAFGMDPKVVDAITSPASYYGSAPRTPLKKKDDSPKGGDAGMDAFLKARGGK